MPQTHSFKNAYRDMWEVFGKKKAERYNQRKFLPINRVGLTNFIREEALLRLVLSVEPKTVLDIGCAFGQEVFALAPSVPHFNADGTWWGRLLRLVGARRFRPLEQFSMEEILSHGDAHIREFSQSKLRELFESYGYRACEIALFPISMARGATSCSPDFSSACRGREDPSLRWSTFLRGSRPVSEGTSFFLRRNSKPSTSSEKLS